MNPRPRVASVPADHPYVQHVLPLGDKARSGPRLLPDPPVHADAGSVRWWPPRMLDPDWLHRHAASYDVLHVHFGFETFSPAHLRKCVETAHSLGKGVVVTVHDLHNPHIEDPNEQLLRLDALVPRADAVLTLTAGAARAVAQRWGRSAIVVPHPHVLPLEALPTRPQTSGRRSLRPRVGVHLKSLRRNTDALGALTALERVRQNRPHDVELVVTIHREVLDPAARNFDPDVTTLARRLSRAGTIQLQPHDPMSDAELFEHVRSLDVSVLPYTWGTHSGWLELCHDLGVRAVAPRTGFYAEQHEPVLFDLDHTCSPPRIAPNALSDAVGQALASRPAPSASRDERITERANVAATHARVYREVSRTRSDVSSHSTSP